MVRVLQLFRLPDGTHARAGRGHLPRPRRALLLVERLLHGQGRAAARGRGRAGAEVEALMRHVLHAVQRLRAPQPAHPGRGADDRQQHHRPGRRSRTPSPRTCWSRCRRSSGCSRSDGAVERLQAAGRDAGRRARDREARAQDRGPGALAGAQEPEGVLSQRAAQGDPQGARATRTSSRARSRSCSARSRKARMPREVAAKAMKELDRLAQDELHVARGHGRAQLPRLAGVAAVAQGRRATTSTSRASSACSTRTTTACARSRSASSSTSRCSS